MVFHYVMNLTRGKGMGGREEVDVIGGLEQILCFPTNRIAVLVDQKDCVCVLNP